jgi:hypothetical protein
MKRLVSFLAVILFVGSIALAGVAQAATAQQNKMTECNAEAGKKDLKGDDRKGFMKTCLSAKAPEPPAAKLTPQQGKMKICNKEAGEKKLAGDERKKFMKSCLSA